MELTLFSKYQHLDTLTTKAVDRLKLDDDPPRIEYSSDVLKLDMKKFFNPKDKREKALLFGTFSKFHHGKIQDAFLTCQKGFKNTADVKYKSLLYLIGIIKKLK